MAIYEARGFQQNSLHLFKKAVPFDYIANFDPLVVPEGADIDEYKRTKAPYCLSGEVTPEKNGSYKRSNSTLLYRDLIFLDYDDIAGTAEEFVEAVSSTLFGYSYILYPTIKHKPEKPRYRLVVKPDGAMSETTYKQVVQEIADKIALPFDIASFTWSQLQGLPVTTGRPEDYDKIVERGLDYPVPRERNQQEARKSITTYYTPQGGRQHSITMRVVETLLNGFGDEGGRNVALTRFVGLLIGKAVRCDIATAWELVQVANTVTGNPLPNQELERTFESIVKREIRKRGIGQSN